MLCVVPQEPALLAGSLRDNIALGAPGATDEAVAAAAARAGCAFPPDTPPAIHSRRLALGSQPNTPPPPP